MIKILTDSTSDLNQDILGKHSIHMIPLNVHFGDDTYKDGIELTPESFYKMLKTNPVHPKTSQPTPEDFKAKYSELLVDGSDIISIHISSKMSGTVQSATIAKNELQSDRIHIIDSEYVSVALGMMATECARMRDIGKNASEIVDAMTNLKKKINIYFVVDTLEYLQKGGRIGKASALIGGILNIKPILTIKDGYVNPYEKIRGSGKVLGRLCVIFTDFMHMHNNENIKLGFAHAANYDLLDEFKQKIAGIHECSDAITVELGPVVGTHGGPGVLAICYYPEI